MQKGFKIQPLFIENKLIQSKNYETHLQDKMNAFIQAEAEKINVQDKVKIPIR